MRRTLLASLAFVLAAALPSCGKKDEKPAPPAGGGGAPAGMDSGTPSSTPSAPPLGPSMETPGSGSGGIQSSWSGRVEKQGPGIAMEGSHKLVDGEGKTIVLLKSTKVDLAALEGKFVTVKGYPSQTVEGGFTIVDVTEEKE